MSPETQIDFVSLITGDAINRMASPRDVLAVAELGLTVESLRKFEIKMQWDVTTSERILHISRCTLGRYAKHKQRLNLTVSENALAVAKLATIGMEYFGSQERWKKWLSTPHIQFNNMHPESVMHFQQGRELITRDIYGLEHGFSA